MAEVEMRQCSHANIQKHKQLLALNLVRAIEESMTKGTRHWRTRSGRLLYHLDEVIRAILENNLAVSQ